MAFGYDHWKTTPAGIEVAWAIKCRADDIIAAAKSGIAPIKIIAPDIQPHLGDKQSNSLVGRMIREWLGPNFQVVGRVKWGRQHGTDSGAIFRQRQD